MISSILKKMEEMDGKSESRAMRGVGKWLAQS